MRSMGLGTTVRGVPSRRGRLWPSAKALVGGGAAAALLLQGLLALPASAAPAPITIALVISLTGPGATQLVHGPAGFYARIDQQNAYGGVNGRKIRGIVVDDQTTNATIAVQDAISRGAFAIVSESPLFFTAAKIPQKQGIPVTGTSFDGPEWGEQPYTNMFAVDTGSVDPGYPASTLIGSFIRQHGGTVLGTYGYSISPQSTYGAKGNAISMKHAGGKVGVLNTSIPVGSVNFTTASLVAKQTGVNALIGELGNASNFALATAYQQEGVKPKVVIFPSGYEQDVIGSPTWRTVQGDYFLSAFRPFSLPNAGTRAMAAAMQKYEHWNKSQFPNLSQYDAWLGADLMIRGLTMAGKNPRVQRSSRTCGASSPTMATDYYPKVSITQRYLVTSFPLIVSFF